MQQTVLLRPTNDHGLFYSKLALWSTGLLNDVSAIRGRTGASPPEAFDDSP